MREVLDVVSKAQGIADGGWGGELDAEVSDLAFNNELLLRRAEEMLSWSAKEEGGGIVDLERDTVSLPMIRCREVCFGLRLDFGVGGIRSEEGAVVHEKQVCFENQDVVNEEWNRRTLRGILGVDRTG